MNRLPPINYAYGRYLLPPPEDGGENSNVGQLVRFNPLQLYFPFPGRTATVEELSSTDHFSEPSERLSSQRSSQRSSSQASAWQRSPEQRSHSQISSSQRSLSQAPPSQAPPSQRSPSQRSASQRPPSQASPSHAPSHPGQSPRAPSLRTYTPQAPPATPREQGPPPQRHPQLPGLPGLQPPRSPPRRPPPRGSPPRGFPPSPGPMPNMPRPPFERAYPTSLRDQPVKVMLDEGGQYLCNRADILEHLPNTRQAPFGRTLEPRIAVQNQIPAALEALHQLFRGLEQYRTTGTPLYMFERARAMLNRDTEYAWYQCFDFFVGTCAALDSEFGLGCSEELLQQIDEFAIDLMYTHELGTLDHRNPLLDFFVAYAKVFQPTTPRHLDTLRELWNCVPAEPRAWLMVDLAQVMDWRAQRSNVNAMFRAMRDMGMA